MSLNTSSRGGPVKGLGWPKRLARFGRALGWPGAVSRGTDEGGAPVDAPSTSTSQVDEDVVVEAVEVIDDRDASVAERDSAGLDSGVHDGGSEAGGSGSAEPADLSDLAEPSADAHTTDDDAVSRGTADESTNDESTNPELKSSGDPEPAPSEVIAPDQESSPEAAADGLTAGEPVADLREGSPEAPAVAPPVGPRRARFDQDEFDNAGAAPDDIDPARVPDTRRTLPRPHGTRTFVVANQKGGVGKTTTSVNLAAALALGGLHVLVLDLDPQGNASTALGIDHGPGTPGTYEVLIEGAAIADHLVPSPEAPNLQVLPATIDLAGAEIQLVSTVARENRLRKALRAYLADHPVDYVFLDCPPSLGLITLNALVAASEILIPIQCEYYALEGVSQLVRTINLVKGELNEDLDVSTVLLTMYDARTRLAAQVADEVRAYFAGQTLPTVIPRSVRISEAPSYGQTVLTYHPDSAGAVSYLEAAREIARRGAEERT